MVEAKRKTGKDWSKLTEADWEALDDEWESGDNAEELETEDMVQIKRMEEEKEKIMSGALDPDTMDLSNPHAFAAEHNNPGGPTMMFATMRPLKPDGSSWTKQDTVETGSKWRELAATGGLDVTSYEIADDKLLITLQRGWEGKSLKKFILQQPETLELEWDQKTYFPGVDYPEKPKKSKKKSKAKKNKKKGGKKEKKQEL